jgi:hypothetical protein
MASPSRPREQSWPEHYEQGSGLLIVASIHQQSSARSTQVTRQRKVSDLRTTKKNATLIVPSDEMRSDTWTPIRLSDHQYGSADEC